MSVKHLPVQRAESRLIVVEGPVGVGKTDLARKLAFSLSGEPILEEMSENPFLEQFYKTGGGGALPAQLFFLFQRAKKIEELRQSDMFSPVRVANFHINKDRLFAAASLDREELALYDQMYEKMDVDPPIPDLVIYLQSSVDSLMQRITRRSVMHERFINRQYLEKITEAYARFYHDYDEAPLLIVNASAIDPINNDSEYKQLFEQVCRTTSGRHFFNLASAAVIA